MRFVCPNCGIERVPSGSSGMLRADPLARLAYRLRMLGEARAYGLDAARRAFNEDNAIQQPLFARLATYEANARLPGCVPALVLVLVCKETLCLLVPAGNQKQYLRAVVSAQSRVTRLEFSTFEPGETRCISAASMPASAHVPLTAAEPALLSADLHYYAVDTQRAELL